MSHRPRLTIALCCAIALPSAASAAAGKAGATGTYATGPESVLTVVDAVAFSRRGWDGDRVVVLLATAPLAHGDWAATLDPAGLAERYREDTSWVEIELTPDGSWAGSRYTRRWSGGMSSSSSFGTFDGETPRAAIGDGRVTGTLRHAFGDGTAVDVTLDAPLLAPTGEPLPADGGEPAAAARACNAAFTARDLAAVERACSPSTGDIVESALRLRGEGYEMEDPWTPAGASECDVAAVSGLVVTGGVLRGEEARVDATGGWVDDGRCEGHLYLRRDGGRWRVARSAMVLAAPEG